MLSVDSSDRLMLDGIERLFECPACPVCGLGPAPESCPCTSWPPAEWPCGGLVEQYSVEMGVVHTCTSIDPVNPDFSLILSPTNYQASATQCQWAAAGADIVSNLSVTNCSDANVASPGSSSGGTLRLNTTGGLNRWDAVVGFRLVAPGESGPTYIYYFIKETGLTPIGDYVFHAPGSFTVGSTIPTTATLTVS